MQVIKIVDKYIYHYLPTSLAPIWQFKSLADKSDLWKLRQVPKFGCGSFGGTSKGKQANSAILHSAAKKKDTK